MSTQNDPGVPFEICNDQQNFRLLELPAPLLELITSNRISNLDLKSGPPNVTDGSSQNAILCTNDQTYQVRQVQSSNSVFVLQTSESSQVSEDNDNPPIFVSAVAQCAIALELVPSSVSPVLFLKQAIPLYPGSESMSTASSREINSRDAIQDDAPFSTGEFGVAWKQLCSFELEGQAWVPSASLLVSIWNSTISAAVLRGVKLEDSFSIDALEAVVEEDGFPRALLRAIISRLSSEQENALDGRTFLNKDETVPWVGAAFLESKQASGNSIPLVEFLQGWRDLLPENWRASVGLNAIRGKYIQPSKDSIMFNRDSGEGKEMNKGSDKNKKRWHERFKNARS